MLEGLLLALDVLAILILMRWSMAQEQKPKLPPGSNSARRGS